MVTLGLGVVRAGIYGVAGSVQRFWDHSFRISVYDPSQITHYSNVDTLYRSDDLTIGFFRNRPWPAGMCKGEDGSGMRSLLCLIISHAATLLLHSAILFRYTHSGWRMLFCLFPSVFFGLLALNSGPAWSTLHFPPPKIPHVGMGNKKQLLLFLAFCFLHDQMLSSRFFPNRHSHLNWFFFPSRHALLPTSRYGTERARPKRRSLGRKEIFLGKSTGVFFLASSLFLFSLFLCSLDTY